MSSSTQQPALEFRIVCVDYTHERPTLDSARRCLADIERLDICRELHTIEVLAGGEWLPLHIHTARQILAAPLGPVETIDGPLVKYHGRCAPDAEARANAAGPVDSPEWHAALRPHVEANLSADGRGVDTTGLCKHNPAADTWVRYERWTAEGRAAHGYVCPDTDCRRITQTG